MLQTQYELAQILDDVEGEKIYERHGTLEAHKKDGSDRSANDLGEDVRVRVKG